MRPDRYAARDINARDPSAAVFNDPRTRRGTGDPPANMANVSSNCQSVVSRPLLRCFFQLTFLTLFSILFYVFLFCVSGVIVDRTMEVSIFKVHAQVESCTYIQLLATLNFVSYLVSFLIDILLFFSFSYGRISIKKQNVFTWYRIRINRACTRGGKKYCELGRKTSVVQFTWKQSYRRNYDQRVVTR